MLQSEGYFAGLNDVKVDVHVILNLTILFILLLYATDPQHFHTEVKSKYTKPTLYFPKTSLVKPYLEKAHNE